MDVQFTSLGKCFKVEFNLADMEPAQKAVLLFSLLRESGLDQIMLDPELTSEAFRAKIDAAYQRFVDGKVSK